MKKLLALVTVAFALTALNAVAQTTDNDKKDDRPRIGAKAGINFSNVYDMEDDAYVAEGKSGLAIGGFLSLPLTEYLGFQPEVMFSQKGFQGKGGSGILAYSFTRTTNFIDVPLLLQIKPVKELRLLAGPQYSFLMSQVNTFNSDFVDTERREEFDNEEIRRNILALTVGGDVVMDYFVFSARASWDLVRNNGDGTSDDTPRYRNSVIQFTLGIMF